MKYILTIISIIISYGISQGQSFEGKLTYKVDFEINAESFGKLGITKEMILDKMKKEGEFYDELSIYIKGGNYIKEINSTSKKRVVYKSEENLIYVFEGDSEYLVQMKGENPSSVMLRNAPPAMISEPDTLKVVNGDTCKLVKLNWGNLASEHYWYSKERVQIDSDLFKEHNYELLNEVLAISNAYPMEMSKSVGNGMTITITIVNIEAMKLEEDLFRIPELKKSNKKGHKHFGGTTGNKIMKIKN